MINYTPFLKLKTGEIKALFELEPQIAKDLVPFFDYAKKENITEDKFIKGVARTINSLNINCQNIPSFYLDDFDIDSTFQINNKPVYSYLIQEFQNFNWIPVFGIDRNPERIQTLIDSKSDGLIQSDLVAFRITPDDFSDYDFVEDDIDSVLDVILGSYKMLDLIFDCRECFRNDPDDFANNILAFIAAFKKEFEVRKIILTGSSIPSSIRDIADVDNETIIQRNEIEIFKKVRKRLPEEFELVFGDYGAVSPNYSDLAISPKLMPQITVPKIVYAYNDKQYIARAHALKTHGYNQFQTLFRILKSKQFYRGSNYSYGDNYIDEKGNGIGSNAMPHSVVKPLCNAHITFMAKEIASFI